MVLVNKMMRVEFVVEMIVLVQDVLMQQHAILILLQSLMMALVRFLMIAMYVAEIIVLAQDVLMVRHVIMILLQL